MSEHSGTLLELLEAIKRKAPEYYDLLVVKTDEEFEQAFTTLLEQAIHKVEANKKNFSTLSEDGISAAFALAMDMPGLTVTQEQNSNGHVDLTITADHCFPMRTKLGEAKIYDGPEYHVKGLEQLLKRYTTGREGRGLVLAYFKKPGIAMLLKKVRNHMEAEKPCNQKGAIADHAIKWGFVSTHTHSCGEDLEVSHVGCNLHCESEVKTSSESA